MKPQRKRQVTLQDSSNSSKSRILFLKDNFFMPQVNIQPEQRIKSEQSFTKRIMSAKKIERKQEPKKIAPINLATDPIFQIQMENYMIGQMVKKGYFRIRKEQVSLSTQTQRILKSQPSQESMNVKNLQQSKQSQQTMVVQEPSNQDKTISDQIVEASNEPKISVKAPSSYHGSDSLSPRLQKHTSNPFKLKNIISSRFQQILDLVQDSQQSTPKSLMKSTPLIRRQNTVQMQREQQQKDYDRRKREEFNQKEFEAFLGQHKHKSSDTQQQKGENNSRRESRRSGVRISTPEIANQLSKEITSNAESFKQSFKTQEEENQFLLKPQQSKMRLQRKNVLALQYSSSFIVENSHLHVPKFAFFFYYYQNYILWNTRLILTQKKQIMIQFFDTTFNKITYEFEIQGIPYDQINSWIQVSQQFFRLHQNYIGSQISYLNYNNELTEVRQCSHKFIIADYDYELKDEQIRSMSLMKDVFRLLFNTYLYEYRTLNGIKLKLHKEKDITLIAIRELMNVLQFYKQTIRKALLQDNQYYQLVISSMGETIRKNIGLINKLFNLRFNSQPTRKYLIHKQLVRLKDVSITEDNDTTFIIIKASLILQRENILYFHKRDYFPRSFIDIELEVESFTSINQQEYTSLRLKYEAIEKMLESKDFYNSKNIADLVLFQQKRFLLGVYQFIRNKLMINEQKQLQIRMNIFSLQDAQKLEACGLKFGFLRDLKTKSKPYAISEIERFIYDDTKKKREYELISQTIYQREHLFDKHFNAIFADDNQTTDNNIRNQSSLIAIVKRYQPNLNENKDEISKKVGYIQIYSEYPFTDQHLDDYADIQYQYKSKNITDNKVYYFRQGWKGFSIKFYQQLMDIRYHQWKHYQKFIYQKCDEEDNTISMSKQFIKNAPHQIVSNCLYKRMSQKVLKTSFRNTLLYDGFDLLKQIKSKSTVSEIPSYHILHYILLNNCNYLLKFFNLKQFILLQKIKHYGVYQIIIRVFYRFQKTDILTETDYFLLRLDFQSITKKIGMMKLIFNRYDIVEILKIPIFTQMSDSLIVDTAMKIFERAHLGTFQLCYVPYFTNQSIIQGSDQKIQLTKYDDHSTQNKVVRIRRISNYPENTSFKKADLCKGFLDTFIKNHRLILIQIKKLYLILHSNHGQIMRISSIPLKSLSPDQICQQEFVSFQIFKHLLLDQWIVKLYIPRTTRQMATVIKLDDFKQIDDQKIIDLLNKCKNPNELDISLSESQAKMTQLSKFQNLSNRVTEFLEYGIFQENHQFQQSLEKQIWSHWILTDFNLDPYKKANIHLTLLFQGQEFMLQEMLFQRYIRIERVGESHIEFYLKYSQKQTEGLKGFALLKGKLNQLQGSRFSGLIYELKYNEEQVRMLKRTSIFFPFDAISYANTSNYNIEMKYFSYNKFTEVKEQINLRELLNLYIADGFYKYQTNYMNSKLNLSDVISICYYIIFKIKNQNFLNLSQHHTIPNLNQIKTRKYSPKAILSQFRCYIHPYFCSIQLIIDEIQITCMHMKTQNEITQIFPLSEIDQEVFGFKYLVNKHPKLALQRLSKQLYKIVNIKFNN